MRVELKGRRDERGAVAIIVAFSSVLLLIMAAFVVDFGQAYANKRQSQTAADAAVLAAGTTYSSQLLDCPTMQANNSLWNLTATTAKKAADDLIAENLGRGPDVRASGFNVTCNAATKQFVIYYSIDKDSPLGLGSIVTGGDHVTVQRDAEATVAAATPAGLTGGCTLCFLGSLDIQNADYTVTGGGDIYVNGNATSKKNNGHFAANKITVTGAANGSFSPAAVTGPPFLDPFASMPMPLPSTGLTNKSDPCGSGATHGPGVYGAVDLPNGPCALQPGAYVITGVWAGKNKTNLTGTGVTLYFKSSNGALALKNGSATNLSAPTTAPLSGWPTGFVIIYDRNNTNSIGLQGNGGIDPVHDFIGGIYAPASTLDFNGEACFKIDKGPVVVKSGTGNGNKGCVTVTNASNVGGTPVPPVAGKLKLTK
jgi:hypothetical protein